MTTTESRQGETALEAPERDSTPPRRRLLAAGGRRRPLALLLALAFFFGPAGAYLAGQRPEEIENRRLKPMPSLSEGWRFFPDFAAWTVDHLPLRRQAVHADGTLSERVFHEPPVYGGSSGDVGAGPVGGGLASAGQPPGSTPGGRAPVAYPPVVQGKDGWLYFGGDVGNACTPLRSVDDTLSRLRRLATAVQASGRRFVLVIPPDKTTMVPQYLPATFLGKGCMTARKSEFWSKLRADPPPGYVDLRGAIEAAQRQDGGPAYRMTDTHWGDRGSVQYARLVAQALQPNLWATSRVYPTGVATRRGDLGVFIGRPHVDSYRSYDMVRPGVQIADVPPLPLGRPVTVTATTTGAPLFGPHTLLLGDSFTNSSLRFLPKLFANLTLWHNEAASARPALAAQVCVDSDVVVYEVVERTIASGRGAVIDDKALTAIEAALKAHPRR